MHGKHSLPEPEVEDEAEDHADGCAGLGGEAREGAEQEDAEQAPIGNRRDGETDLDDVAFAADGERVDRDGEENESPKDGGGLADDGALAVVGAGAEVHVEVDDRGGRKAVERGGEIGHGGRENGGNEQAGDTDGHLTDDEGGEDSVGT